MANLALRIGIAIVVSGLIWVFSLSFIRDNRAHWTEVSMQSVSAEMGDQTDTQKELDWIDLQQSVIYGVAILLTIAAWSLALLTVEGDTAKKGKRFSQIGMLLLMIPLVAACSPRNYVQVTPPNYAIVISMSNTSGQSIGNDFSNAELVSVNRIVVEQPLCSSDFGRSERCYDKMVIEVPGAPESRVYTKDPDTGTSGADEAICFEASGVNGCVDFSVVAIVERDNAICYANKVGIRNMGDFAFHFEALPLAESLDTRVVQIASARMVEETATLNPLDLAASKFAIFDGIRDEIVSAVYEQTCITILSLDLNGGIRWDSEAVQSTIDDAIVLQNQITLAQQQASLDGIEAQNLINRMNAFVELYGVDVAVQLITLQEWDGSFMPSSWTEFVQPTETETVATVEAPEDTGQ